MSRFIVRVLALAGLLVAALAAPPASALVNPTPSAGWRPSNGIVHSMARVGDMVVLGGTFTRMISPTGTSVTRNRLAAVSAVTGDLLAWNPNPDGTVRAVAGSPEGSLVYVGGTFTTVGGQSRANLAAVSAASGLASAFRADTSAGVRSLLVHDGGLFVGGLFGRVNNVTRRGAAEVDPLTGALRAWNPNVSSVYTIAHSPDGSTMLLGGTFRTVGGQPRDFAAQVSRSSGAPLPWTSGSTCQDSVNICFVHDIAVSTDTVYLAVAGPGGRVTALDALTGRQKWWKGTDGDVQTVVLEDRKLYVGGHFEKAFDGIARAGLVALEATTGAVLPELSTPVHGPPGGSGVWRIIRDGDLLRFAGQFTTIGTATIGKYSTFTISPDPLDTRPPARPGSLRAHAALADAVSLSWAAAADDVATVAYRISRDGTQIGQSSNTLFQDRTVRAATRYTYTVTAVDFSGNVGPPSTALTVTTEPDRPVLLRRDATWSVFSQGVSPGAGWQLPAFIEVNWSRGVGEFGFGDGDEATIIAPLGVAHYFRTAFDVVDPAGIESATLRLRLDDGAVVYVNGEETSRINLPGGAITNDTTAVTSLSGSAEIAYSAYAIPANRLVAGRNQLAVEVHNSSTASSDVSMDAFMTYAPGSQQTLPSAPVGLHADPRQTSVELGWDATPNADSYRVGRDGVEVGTTTATTFLDGGLAAATTYRYTVRAVNEVGTGPASDPVTATTTAEPVTPYVVSGDTWRVNDAGADLGEGWRAAAYDDSSWRTGPTQMGYGDGDERTLLTWGSNANAKPITNYARIRFDAGGSVSDVTGLAWRAIVDDGAVAYLNGAEIWRFNLPTGVVSFATRASTALSGTAESTWRSASLPPGALQPGVNTLAVEVHQDSPGSSDVSLDVELSPVS